MGSLRGALEFFGTMILMEAVCKVCGQTFLIAKEDLSFYQKISVPKPTLCPYDRRLRRLVFRNDRKLYRRKCDLCKKMIIATYDATAPFPVYCPDCWWSDQWDGEKFGRDFDFNRPFFEQWNELNKAVPHISLWQIQNENSEYSHDASYNKDCYMLFASDYNRDCYYSWACIRCKDIVDSAAVYISEQCYECTDSIQCHSSTYGSYLRESSNCHFCFDLINCHNCFGSSGLRAKQYYWFNQQLSKEEWERRFRALRSTHEEIEENRKKAYETSLKVPRKYVQQKKCEDCTGHSIGFSKNVRDSYDAEECRDCAHGMFILQCKDLVDVDIAYNNVELCYESHSLIKNCFRVFFSYFVRDAKEFWYSTECYASSNLFGCVGLRNKKYCILNKSYSKEAYEETRKRVIEHMKKTKEFGEFFPTTLTPLAYNETAAPDYIEPISREEVLKRGMRWKEEDPREYQKATFEVPQTIKETPESIVNETLACEQCRKHYRVIPQELRFYRQMNIPVPKRCFDCRHADRLKRRGPRKLFDRNCQKCGVQLQTVYAPDSPELIYCESCYLKEVY